MHNVPDTFSPEPCIIGIKCRCSRAKFPSVAIHFTSHVFCSHFVVLDCPGDVMMKGQVEREPFILGFFSVRRTTSDFSGKHSRIICNLTSKVPHMHASSVYCESIIEITVLSSYLLILLNDSPRAACLRETMWSKID